MTKHKRETASFEATIPVTENLTHAMYLRESIGTGKADNGDEIEISLTGASIVIMRGKWQGGGRQLVISISDLTTAVLTQLTEQPVKS